MPQDITNKDVQALSSPDQITSFFLNLGYDIDAHTLSSVGALGIRGDSSHAVKHVERIARLDDGYSIEVYLFQLNAIGDDDREERDFACLS